MIGSNERFFNELANSSVSTRREAQALPDENVPARRELAWRPTVEQIESAVAGDFGVTEFAILSKRVKSNEARLAALYLIRQLTTEPVTQLAARYGAVSQAPISKSVKRATQRMETDKRWQRRLDCLAKSLGAAARSTLLANEALPPLFSSLLFLPHKSQFQILVQKNRVTTVCCQCVTL